MMWQKRFLISAGVLRSFSSSKSLEMSSSEQMISHADPTKKLMIGVKQNRAEWADADSAAEAIKYPMGVFQLNGNLKNSNGMHFIGV